jgi:DtxR family Mn-dependent transcriptional regulator
MMADLIDTTEMYLRTILELEEEGQVPLRARISERLEHSGPTVSQTIGRMERLGYVVVSNDRHLELTDFGRDEATKVMRKHRLAERLLADVIGLEWEFVHEEACRWEHVISEQVERKIMALLDNPRFSPYGNPIPGLEELGAPKNQTFIDGVVSVPSLPLNDPSETFTLRRIGEPLQVDVSLLADLKALGIVPGAELQIETRGTRFFVRAVGQTDGESLAASDAAHLFVDAR